MAGGGLVEKVISVRGMSCGHCQAAVDKALRAVPGVQEVSVDLKGETATVAWRDDETSLAQLVETIRDVGYETDDA